MTFSGDLEAFQRKLNQRNREIFVGVASEVHRSVQEGSELTGAPGQPVDTGNLRASWQLQFPSPTLATTTTNVVYAPAIEDGVGPYGPLTLRSAVGGWHSAKTTVAGFKRIVAHVRQQVVSK